ncbi:MAG: uridine diphosphate-N-acetylglucosamine-binding protein YvcK [Acidobacteriota bacterium]|nr:uridine diphosphate-N-acetylglucosamine-binding protein YvcK [Acidobacteriota bacterium]
MRRQSCGPRRVVCIGGGSGMVSLLSGLRPYTEVRDGPGIEVTAIVTAIAPARGTRMRRGFQPPADIRRYLTALASPQAPVMRALDFRFPAGTSLRGQVLGDLMFAAVSDLEGGLPKAVDACRRLLRLRGKVVPSTTHPVTIERSMANGSLRVGETAQAEPREATVRQIRLLPRRPAANPDAIEALLNADLITMGPGPLFAGLIGTLLVEGIASAVYRSAAPRILIGNLMSEPAQTTGYTLADQVDAIRTHTGFPLIDLVLSNRAPVDAERLARYRRCGSAPVRTNPEVLRGMNIMQIEKDLLSDGPLIRHDLSALGGTITELFKKARKTA